MPMILQTGIVLFSTIDPAACTARKGGFDPDLCTIIHDRCTLWSALTNDRLVTGAQPRLSVSVNSMSSRR